MTQINDRKEPTFGTPNENNNPTSINSEKNVEMAKVNLSIHSDKAPNYTFTPVMKRPTSTVEQLSSADQTLEEQTMLKNLEQAAPKSNSGFSFTPVKEDEIDTTQSQPQAHSQHNDDFGADKTPDGIAPTTAERVIPTVKLEDKIEKIPSKYRRLLIVLLLLLSVIIVIVLLKPKMPDTAQALQEQGTSLPIEFRPVDEEEAKRAEEQAKALQAAQLAEKQAAEKAQNMANTSPATTQETSSVVNNEVAQSSNTVSTQSMIEPVAQNVVTPAEVVKPVEQKPAIIEPISKPESTTSVIYQPEVVKKANVEKPKPAPQPKVEKVVEKATEKVVVKPQTQSKPVEVKSVASSSSKVLTVPKGVSLMQVFRDNKLNISDVNAMSKVNNIVSNLKVGEKIIVQLDKNNRVTEMKIGSGGRFIRQANGSYIYK